MDAPQALEVAASGQKGPSLRRERGQTLAVVAVMIVLLVAFLGLVIDGGNVYAQRRQMQNAADAAALAGARALALGKGNSAAKTTAEQFAQANGAAACVPKTETYTVTVAVSKTVPTYFASVIGIREMPVSAVASAAFFKPRGYGNMLPLTILSSTWATNTLYTIWIGDQPTEPFGTPETRGWLNIDGGNSNADELTCFVCPDCPGTPTWTLDSLPFWVNSAPGLTNAGVQALADCHASYKKYEMPEDDPRRDVVVPLFDRVCERPPQGSTPPQDSCWVDLGTGNMNYRIVGFAMFHIVDVQYQGDPKTITGYFLANYVPSGDGQEASDEFGSEHGMSIVRLVR